MALNQSRPVGKNKATLGEKMHGSAKPYLGGGRERNNN